MPILGTLPADAYNKIISMNIKGDPAVPGNPGPDLTPDVVDGAGAVPADNWNNLEYSGVAPIETAVETYDHTQLVDNSGAGAVSMSLTQNGYDRRPGTATGRVDDPNLNLYKSQASAASGDISSPSSTHTLLEGLQEELMKDYPERTRGVRMIQLDYNAALKELRRRLTDEFPGEAADYFGDDDDAD